MVRGEGGHTKRGEGGGRFSQGMINIAGLGMPVVASRQIANPLCAAELLEPRPPSIVEQPDFEVRIVKGDCTGVGFFQNFQRFIVCRNIDVYPRQVFRRQGTKSCLMGVGLGVTVARSQESDVEYKRIEQGEYLAAEAAPHPSDLIPFA